MNKITVLSLFPIFLQGWLKTSSGTFSDHEQGQGFPGLGDVWRNLLTSEFVILLSNFPINSVEPVRKLGVSNGGPPIHHSTQTELLPAVPHRERQRMVLIFCLFVLIKFYLKILKNVQRRPIAGDLDFFCCMHFWWKRV